MTADTAAVLIILTAAPAATAFPLMYGLTRPWWRSLIGWWIITATTGLALLVDISLIYQWLGDAYALRDVVRLSVYGLIWAGAWMSVITFLFERRRHRGR